jgi:hypothetical protein
VVQLSHTGVKAPEGVNGRPPKAPADFTKEELKALVEAFTFGAKICKDCGVDGVQVHMAHGYLLSSFVDPNQNTRTDEYGGSLENRYRICGEIIRAVRSFAADVAAGKRDVSELTEEMFSGYLDSAGVPDPELVIRPSGEKRTSNFLPWQTVYSEFVYMNVLWPDFAPAHLDEAIAEYHRRNRRFGGA